MRITGHYRLDPHSKAFFGTPLWHVVQRGDELIGRFGRRGTIKGRIDGQAVEGCWKSGDRSGWLKLTFSATDRSFVGEYGVGAAGESPGVPCTGSTRAS